MSGLRDRAEPRTIALAGAGAVLLVSLVVVFARSSAEPPARCAAGMVALGSRCCGEGQHLEADRCTGTPTRCATGLDATASGCVGAPKTVRLEGGLLRVGPGDWEAQGVVTPYEAVLAPFSIDVLEVSEQRFAECVAARACAPIELSGEPGRAVARVTLAEATTFCAWSGGALPSGDQLGFAAAGRAGRRYAWGDTGAVCRRAAWGLTSGPCGEGSRSPEIAGSHPDGKSPEGVLDLAGNVAEWALPFANDPAMAEVRGGSFTDSAASALRSWQRRVVPASTRSAEIGFRCVYAAR